MHDLEIRLFGGVSARTADGEVVDLGPAKCQALLAALAFSPGAAVPVARLVELVWGTDPPRTAEKTLQGYVTGLRKALGAASIERSGGAYRLAVDSDAVDAHRFVKRLASGDTEGALAEWTGHPLVGLDADGLTATVDGLVEQWLGAVETDLARRVETDAAATLGRLTELTADYPFREGLWALRMTALYRVGRQADALSIYHTARQQLVERLGVEPGPRLRELEASILNHDEQLAQGRAPTEDRSALPTGTVTFGFSDVEGSTRLWTTHEQEMGTAMARHDELVRATAARHRGHIFASTGDSFGIAFHRATDAAGWATELQSATGTEPWPDEVEVRLRIGLHTGQAEEQATGYFGPDVNIAERIAQAGHGGQTLVSAQVASLLHGAGVTDLGTVRLTGVATEQHLLQLGSRDHLPLRVEGRRGNLPRRSGRLIGRHHDLQLIEEVLALGPVVTLTGPGGIGKTRLALAAAGMAEGSLAGSAWLIELAGITSSDDVPRAVADTLSIPERPGETLTRSIVSTLTTRRALLVLDNCEQVIAGAAALAEALATGCTDVQVLATSREPLGIAGERVIAVSALDPSDAGAELFNDRALAADQSFDAETWRPVVEEICRRVDGVPLAIELAAARVRSLAPVELVERLDDHLRLLTGGHRTSAKRHRALRSTVLWSYDLLTLGERQLFTRLSAFTAPFDLAAAEQVAADDVIDATEVDLLIGALVDRSMLIVESGPRGRRFRLLETMRQFGAEQLEEEGGSHHIAERHANWCLTNVRAIRGMLSGPDEIEGVERLGELWPNLRAAVHWACATDNRRLARDLLHPVAAEVYLRSQTEIGDWAERLLAITPPDDTELIVFGVTWASRRYMRNLDRDGFQRLVDRFGEPDDPLIRYARGFVNTDYKVMAAAAPRAVEQLRERGDRYASDLFELAGLGSTLLMTGRIDEHQVVMTELVARFRAQGPPTGLNWALTMLGFNASLRGDHNQAWRFFEESMSIEVPDRTHNMKNPLAARTALRRGDRSGAFRILHDYVDDLIENDNLYLARSVACADFVDMMLEVDRVADAARILGHLETSGRSGADSFEAVVARAAVRVSARSNEAADASRAAGRHLDERQALLYMRDVLHELRHGDEL